MPPSERPPTIDPVAAERWAHMPVQPSPWLHEEVARRMTDRLQWIKQQPTAWAHWQPVRGGLEAHGALLDRFAGAACYVVESRPELAQQAIASNAKPWWSPARWKAPTQHAAPPPDGGVQLVWANMVLHMVSDPQALIAQWHRAISTDGFLMFSCLGPDTVRELRGIYQSLGWPPSGHAFTDMHDWGDMLVHAGFAEPVMDMERIRLTYATPERLLADLRELGRNLHPERFAALRARGWRDRLYSSLTERLADAADQGRLPLTFEIIYGHAFKPAPRVKLSAQSAVSLRDMREMLHRGPPGAS